MCVRIGDLDGDVSAGGYVSVLVSGVCHGVGVSVWANVGELAADTDGFIFCTNIRKLTCLFNALSIASLDTVGIECNITKDINSMRSTTVNQPAFY